MPQFNLSHSELLLDLITAGRGFRLLLPEAQPHHGQGRSTDV
jgi:hypothetical protein